MKKSLERDKKTRKVVKTFERKKFILKTISNNSSLSSLVRLNAFHNLNKLTSRASKTFISNRCVYTYNRKKFSKLTNFSRFIFLKLAQQNNIYGLKKSSW